MLTDFKNTVESLFHPENSKAKLKEVLETIDFHVTGLGDRVLPSDQKVFLQCIELVLRKVVGLITEKLLRVPAETDEHSYNFNHDLIHFSVSKLSSITLKSIAIVTSHQSLNVNLFSKLCGPPIVTLYLTFNDHSILKCKEEERLVTSLLNAFLEVVKTSTLEIYLNSIRNSLFVKILKSFTVLLTRETWKSYPITTLAYQQLIELSGRDKLSSVLGIALPPILLLVDDYQPTYVVRGLKFLIKLFSTVPAANMRMFGWAEVIYDALSKKLYDRNVAILDLCLPCLLLVLKVIERDPKKADKQRSVTRYDEVFQILISNLTMCSENDVLGTIWKHLPSYIETMGITVVRHLRDLMQLFQYHLEIGYLANLPYVFCALEATVSVAWVRLKGHTAMLLKQLLTLALRINLNGCEDADVYAGIQRCIAFLYQCNADFVQKTLSGLKGTPWKHGHLQKLIQLPSFIKLPGFVIKSKV